MQRWLNWKCLLVVLAVAVFNAGAWCLVVAVSFETFLKPSDYTSPTVTFWRCVELPATALLTVQAYALRWFAQVLEFVSMLCGRDGGVDPCDFWVWFPPTVGVVLLESAILYDAGLTLIALFSRIGRRRLAPEAPDD